MSLNDKKRHILLPDIYLTEGICRSKSFGGLSHRRTNSADSSFTCSNADVSFDGCTVGLLHGGLGAVFGQSSSLNSTRSFIHGLSSSKTPKLHKSPRPERTQTVFESICKGLKDSILLAQNDITSSRVAFDSVSVSSTLSQGRLYELEKQMKANERLFKKLEFHLSKLEELKEQYDIQHRMRDGIRTMAYAYILSPGKEKDSALQSVKLQFKECTEQMCFLESKLEGLMGNLIFQMKGIQGFARICCGDVFEVVIKHGDQKWKSRGRVIKNGEQLWDNKYVVFKSFFNQPLRIKAIEVRGLGKNIVLGNKYCETRDLFSAHPQQMTINLNPSGSLKLNLIITWNPLDSMWDGNSSSTLSTAVGLPYGRNSISQSSIPEAEAFSELSISTKQGLMNDTIFCDNAGQSFSSESTSASVSAQSSALASPDVESMSRIPHIIDYVDNKSNSTILSSQLDSGDLNFNESLTWSVPMSDENSESHSLSSSESPFIGHNLMEILRNFTLLWEDVSSTYPELKEFSWIIEEINKALKGKSDSSSGSNISISVESALGCFDFLNSAIENEDHETVDNKSTEECIIESAEQNAFDTQMTPEENDVVACKLDFNSLKISSGNEQLDVVLTDQLIYTSRLISVLIASDGVKTVEKVFLLKLKKQQECFKVLLKLLRKKDQIQLSDFFEDSENGVQQLWTKVAGESFFSVFYNISSSLENVIKSKAVLDCYMASKVSHRIILEIVDSNHVEATTRISVLQFRMYFSDSNNSETQLCEIIADALAAEDLKSRDVQKAFAAVSVLSKINPSSYSLFQIGSLLIESDCDLKNIASE
ncbi:rho family-interacting cell polarization regulator 2-like [Uloborus diversus]|uniref:rho family-interacting cell polarization regulator 2-like n=1 Tax=Uloborus diversus TaxID=327109 RepID=UPI00240921B9|nr:rho family-interacting cell polarization regulator 2-like [Uloborus diversus]